MLLIGEVGCCSSVCLVEFGAGLCRAGCCSCMWHHNNYNELRSVCVRGSDWIAREVEMRGVMAWYIIFSFTKNRYKQNNISYTPQIIQVRLVSWCKKNANPISVLHVLHSKWYTSYFSENNFPRCPTSPLLLLISLRSLLRSSSFYSSFRWVGFLRGR